MYIFLFHNIFQIFESTTLCWPKCVCCALLRLIGIHNSPQDLYTMTLETIYTRYNVHNVSKDFFLLLAKGLLYILSESIDINKEAKKSVCFHLDFSIQALFYQFSITKGPLNSQYIWKWTNGNPMKILGQLASHPKLLIGSKLSLG